jgi:equilibrative nucleoside transporter 1/2/3
MIGPINLSINPLVFNALHFLVFNIADLLGRILTSAPLFPTNDTALVIYSLLRTIFIPIFMICNVPGHWPTIITSDTVYMLALFLFGLTCGHCTTLALLSASEKGDPELGGRASRIAQFWMMSGFVVGGIASFGVSALL